MAKTCIKCGYERRESDRGPDYACPSCGVVYAKAEAARAQVDAERMRIKAMVAAAPVVSPMPPMPSVAAAGASPQAEVMMQQLMAAQAGERRDTSGHRGMAIAVLVSFAVGFACAAGLYSGMQKMGKSAAAKASCSRTP